MSFQIRIDISGFSYAYGGLCRGKRNRKDDIEQTKRKFLRKQEEKRREE